VDGYHNPLEKNIILKNIQTFLKFLIFQKFRSSEVQKSRSSEVQKSRSPEVQKSRISEVHKSRNQEYPENPEKSGKIRKI
jgi:hypothetical protein